MSIEIIIPRAKSAPMPIHFTGYDIEAVKKILEYLFDLKDLRKN